MRLFEDHRLAENRFVDRGMHEDILKWDEERKITKTREGIPQIPERFKLDSILLELKEM